MIALVKSLRDSGQLDGPVIVVCPASLVFNWATSSPGSRPMCW